MRHRPVRFLLVGVWNTLVGYLAFLLCLGITHLLDVSYLYATAPAQLLGILNAYLSHRLFTWADGERGFGSFLRFNLVYWVIFGLNLGLLALLVEVGGLRPSLAQAGLTLLFAGVSYLVHGRWSFRVSSG